MMRHLGARPRHALTGLAAVVTGLLLAAPLLSSTANAHPAGACKPRIQQPANGSTTSLRLEAKTDTGGHKNCKLDEIQIIVRKLPGGDLVYTKDWQCCPYKPNPFSADIPGGKLKPGRQYKLQFMYKDKHVFKEPDRKYDTITFRTEHKSGAYGGGPKGNHVTAEMDTNRGGADFDNFDLDTPNPNLCADACESNGHCEAYTYVPPGLQGPDARCWLKDEVPLSTTADGMVSGVKRSPLTQSINVNRGGGDYHNFALNEAEPVRCARACAVDNRCKAYTYVPPGRQGPYARCWLKDEVTRSTRKQDLVSGVK